MAETILIVDDDPVQRRLLEGMATRFGYDVICVEGGDAAVAALTASDARIDCVVLDLVMPDLDGYGVLARMRDAGVNVPVIVQTAHGGIDKVVSAMRAGAADFVVKPVGAERLQVSLRNALSTSALETEFQRLKRSRSGTLTFRDIITRNARMQNVLRVAEKAAASLIPVLIEGESGVGKELIARAVHGSGERRSKPFVAVNCGAIPENLVESMLFGHEKGAFTGAVAMRQGRLEQADKGTLFLDEVGTMPMPLQMKLLRVLQEREFERIGDARTIRVDVRIVAATNADLLRMVKEGAFREDLYYRLNVVHVHLAPLRERPEDIPLLVTRFIDKLSGDKRGDLSISQEAMRRLMSYAWPGNVRQLENAIERAIALLGSRRQIELTDLPPDLQTVSDDAARPTLDLPEQGVNLAALVSRIEQEMIGRALARTDNNKGAAARLLGLKRTTLVEKLKRF